MCTEQWVGENVYRAMGRKECVEINECVGENVYRAMCRRECVEINE